jgi:hypothetical protein
MPKITTFSSQTQLTTNSPEVKSQFQVPITGGLGSQVTAALDKVNDYYVTKQNLQDSVEAKKKFYELKGTTDTFLERQKDNYNEEDAIKNYTNDFEEHSKLELSKIKNSNVRDKIKQELDLEFGQNILKIKKLSFDALEKESNGIYNTGQTTDSAAYKQNVGNTLEQVKISDQMLRRAEEYSNLHKLNDIAKQLKINGVKTTLLLADIETQVMNAADPSNAFKELYTNKNAQTFVKDQDLPKLLIETYKNQISNIAVAGDINSDYTRAIQLVDQVEKLTKPDGTKIITDKNLSDWGAFKEKIYKERGGHEELKLKANNDAEVVKYDGDMSEKIESRFYNKFSTSTDLRSQQDKETASLASDEYRQRSSIYLSANRDADNATKKAALRDISNEIIDKYDSDKIKKYSVYSAKNNKVNYHFMFSELDNLKTDYEKNPSKEHPLVKEAIRFGYKDKKGNADVNQFLLDTLPALRKQLED